MKRPGYRWTTAYGAMLFTLAACGGSPSSDESGSADTTAGTPTTGATSDATTGSTDAPTTGSTDAPTTGGPEEAKFCEERCMVDADCTTFGSSSGLFCKDNRCVRDPCASDDDCLLNGEYYDRRKCVVQADCAGRVCVDVGDGVGRCAATPDAFGCSNSFEDEGQEAMYPPIEGGAPVTVCIYPAYACKDGACFNPCEDDNSCSVTPEPRCDVSTGVCGCNSDADCQIDPESNTPVCNNGKCGCGSDADCAGQGNTDRCYEGTCGCSSVAACTFGPYYDGTVLVCE